VEFRFEGEDEKYLNYFLFALFLYRMALKNEAKTSIDEVWCTTFGFESSQRRTSFDACSVVVTSYDF
jgi:hypothetical protein